MNIIDMPFIIGFIADQVFPLAPLPDFLLTFGKAALVTMFIFWQAASKTGLDQCPAHGVICIIFR